MREDPKKGEKQLIDPFEGGKFLSRADAEKKVKDVTGESLSPISTHSTLTHSLRPAM